MTLRKRNKTSIQDNRYSQKPIEEKKDFTIQGEGLSGLGFKSINRRVVSEM